MRKRRSRNGSRTLIEGTPSSLLQDLDRSEIDFVSHFHAAFYPVSQIDVGQLQFLGLRDLPHDVVSTETGTGNIRVIEGIHRGQTVFENVDDADHAQATARF